MPDDPWNRLTKPSNDEFVAAIRVDEGHPWDFFWALDGEGKVLLVLRFGATATPAAPLPKLQSVSLTVAPPNASGKSSLVLKLTDATHRDLFLRLCLDIVEAARGAATESNAVDAALRRTWRWHHLLRGGSDARLSPESQKGLIGELLVLERHVLVALSARDALRSWRGPSDAPKDFEIGRLCIEVKARRGTATPFVSISSEAQLDRSGTDALFLYVVDLTEAAADTTGFSIADVSQRVRAAVERGDPGAVDLFDQLLSESGLLPEHDYSDSLWLEGDTRVFLVQEHFPCIAGTELRGGVSRVSYSVALHTCAAFVVEIGDLDAAIMAVAGGD